MNMIRLIEKWLTALRLRIVYIHDGVAKIRGTIFVVCFVRAIPQASFDPKRCVPPC